ncbi:FecCD family ABC transporter permease [Brochothrix campestris]|uniref:Probable heme-iron transport system permease protein IsdF n=1 Tax=Brochothrix campestris FSL F6-1037 TaxID=1265861 RepID=W7CE58_9LIST|nr:iron ABC transporter permease [Brochothrix campestris]EUJ35475.1 fecCD transport family protein [Brochothrix campestris FSL F6-1037]
MKNRTILMYTLLTIAILAVLIWALMTGSIKVSLAELVTDFFKASNEKVAIVKDLRLPRIILALVAGAALSVCGLLLQAIMRNPLADAGVIGISAGAHLMQVCVVVLVPQLFYWTTMVSFVGGALACFLVFLFSARAKLNPLSLIIIGVAINAVFTGLGDFVQGLNPQLTSQATVSFGMKKWSDVESLVLYGGLGLIAALFLTRSCNLLALKDEVLIGLGVSLKRKRLLIATVAVLLAASATAIVGVIAFIGLLVPHIARSLLKTNDHRKLLPFVMILGAFLLLVADTLGRSLVPNVEIAAGIMMMVIGGPFLIALMWRQQIIR